MSSPDPQEDRLRTLLEQAGRRPEPPEAKKRDWEGLFRGELDRVVAARRQRRRRTVASIAAVIVLFAGAFAVLRVPEQPAIVVAEVMAVVDDNQTYANGNQSGPLMPGSNVHVGQTVRTAAKGTLALAYRHADVRLHHDTTVVFHASRIELVDGSVYVDTGRERKPGALPVIVTTALGSFSHMGTQFLVMVDEAQEVTASVREGTIHLRTENVQQNFNATDAGAEVIKISKSGHIETSLAPGHGGLWAWVVDSSPGKTIDGMSLHEVMSWIARETGLVLKYESNQSRTIAAEATVVAPPEPMNPHQALKFVNAVTSLHADASQGVALIVSSSEGDQNPD